MIGIYLLIALLLVATYVHFFGVKGKGWKIVTPAKKGGSFSLYFMDKHIANVRGKTKADVLLSAIQGKDITSSLEMPTKIDMSVTKSVMVKPVAKKVATKKVVVKTAKKVVAKKPVAKKVVAKTTKKVAAKKVTKK